MMHEMKIRDFYVGDRYNTALQLENHNGVMVFNKDSQSLIG